jgi:hypothetical protein
MTDVIDARSKLNDLAGSLDRWSRALAQTSRDLEPVEEEYRTFVDDFEIGLLTKSEDEEGYKLPSASLRLKLAHKAMNPELLGRYMGLTKARERQLQRIRDLSREIDAYRSLVSAAKAELDATR